MNFDVKDFKLIIKFDLFLTKIYFICVSFFSKIIEFESELKSNYFLYLKRLILIVHNLTNL